MSGNASLEEDDVYSDAISTEQTNENVPLIMAEETNKTEQEVGIEGSPLTQAAATIGNPEAQTVGTEMSPGSKEAGTADSPRIPITGQQTGSKTDTMLTNVYDPKDDPEYNSFGDDAISYGYDSDSSEFDSFSDQEMTEKDEYSEKPLPPVPKKKKKAFKIPKVIKGRFKSKSLGEKGTVLPVSINLKKHPPPELPPTPDNLTQQQIKKRHVIESIISSEKSYIESLQRILKVYEKELLYTYGLDTKDSSVKFVFLKIREILNYHLMFQIELADRVKKYDQEEKIGSIFINSFSRAMVSEVYSDYVNKFSIAMEEIKRAQNANPALKKFLLDQVGVYPAPKVSDSEPVSKEIQVLKECGQESHDRLSIFGLMVKPIQRFPQFIMLLKDLIKYTPTNHHDRGALQGAITDLENVAHRLNESKRECEQQLEAKKLTKRISKNLPDKASRLLREDEFEHLEKNGSDIRVKKRQVFLLDDCLIVATTSNSSMEEKRGQEPLRLKIYCSLKDLELKDSAISPDMHSSVNLMPTHMSITSRIKVPPNEDLYHLYSDMNDMMHDLPVLGKISSLINSLRKSYSGLSEDLIHETVRDLQHMIQIKDQQLQLLNSCCINLHNIVKNERYTFQTATPELKQRWCKDFQMAKYALEPQNNPSWLRAEESCSIQPAVFMKWFSVDMPRNFTSMKCAVPVYLTSAGSQDIGIQHLWIVMTKEHRTYISLVSTQSVRPQLVESFQAISEEVVAVETIPGFATVEKENAFMEDTVWMSTTSSKIFVYSLTNEQDKKMARKPVAEFYCHGVAMVIHDAIDRVFVGLANGNLAIYDRNEEGEWNFCSPHTVVLDTVPVRCIVSLEEQVWVSCRDAIYIFNYEENKPTETVDLKMKNESCSREINCIVHTGVGLWLSFKDESTIYMLHAEFKDIQQECNITKAVERVLQDMDWNHSKAELCTVTSLMASRGFLWVGTSVGIVLLYSLPRLKDGVPRIWGKPWVSCHSHNGPIKFLLPIYCDTVNVWRSFSQTDIISIPSPSKEAKKEKTSEQKETNGENDSENPDLVNNVPNETGLSVSSPSSPTGTEEKDLNTDADSKVLLRKGSRSLLSENENLMGTEDEIKSSKAVDPENNNMRDSFAKVLPVDKNDMITSPERSMSLSQSKPDQYPPINLSRKSYGNEKLHAELSNRLGLQNKGLRRSLPNLLDIDKEEDEITLYYDELMTYKDGPEALKVDSLESKTETFQSVKVANEFRSKMSETLQNTPSVPKEKDKNSIFSRTNPVMHSYSVKSETKRTAIKPSLSLKSPLKDVQKMKALDTMGKRTCNAVIVVSGGDGYFDWRKINERNVIRNDEASLMMWMYKF